ncbi:MAG: shikimate kinase [Ruminococcaceae bacterium]|nr:shikimate kinase [Oscillospiraceae bacterium]
MKNVILVGMPGSGKSTLGILLAKKIHYGYIDSDSVIVAGAGKLLPDLIAELGNEGFLALEARVNASLDVRSCVISTGGSAIYRGDVIEKMKKNGVVVYLKISYEEMAKRLGDYKRRGVVLQEGFTLRDLYEERAPLYERHADYILPLDGETVEESTDKLVELLGDAIRAEDYAGIL